MNPKQTNPSNLMWQTYMPYEHLNVDNVPHTAGVYAIWRRSDYGSPWEVVYVGIAGGETNNLHDRLLDHLADTEPNSCLKNLARDGRNGRSGFSYAELPSEADRKGAEKYLYDEVKRARPNDPECNVNDPGGTPLPVTLPDPPPA